MAMSSHHARRGSVSAEYVVLASLLAGTVTLGIVFPQSLGSMLWNAGNNMDRNGDAAPSGVNPPSGQGGDAPADPSGDPPGGGTPPTFADPTEPSGPEDDGPADANEPPADPWGDNPWTPTGGDEPFVPGDGPELPPTVVSTPVGSVTTLLLTLMDPGIPEWVASTLANNLVESLAGESAPRILVVRDDYHHNEDIADTNYVVDLLVGGGHDVTFLAEGAAGLTPADVAGYDIVWYSNPGWPTDEGSTLETLQNAVEQGVHVVLQGDDMTFTHADDFDMESLTGAEHVSNGTRTDGVRTDNRSGGNFEVVFGSGESAVLDGLEGVSVLYGNDIDHSTITGEGVEVLAWAWLAGTDGTGTVVPVIFTHPVSARE